MDWFNPYCKTIYLFLAKINLKYMLNICCTQWSSIENLHLPKYIWKCKKTHFQSYSSKYGWISLGSVSTISNMLEELHSTIQNIKTPDKTFNSFLWSSNYSWSTFTVVEECFFFFFSLLIFIQMCYMFTHYRQQIKCFFECDICERRLKYMEGKIYLVTLNIKVSFVNIS